MDRAQSIVEERQAIGYEFNSAFSDLKILQTPFTSAEFVNGFQSYPCMVTLPENISEINKYRNRWMELLMDQGIQQDLPHIAYAKFLF